MRSSLIVLGLAVALAAPAALARTSFTGNACNLATAKQVSALGIAGPCKARSIKGPGFTNSMGTWGTLGGSYVSVGVNTYPSKSGSSFQVAMKTLSTLAGGTSKKVTGIGSVAYEAGANGSTRSSMNFVVGKQIANIELRTPTPQKSFGPLNTFAKAVAARL